MGVLTVASLFAGCGGSSTGYRDAGFEVRYACELDDDAADVYEANGGVGVDRRDVCEVRGDDIGEVDVLDMSAPCQDFSTAGPRNLEGDRAGLFYEGVRLVGEVMPRAFVAENVTGLVKGEARERHFDPIMRALRGHGYTVKSRILDGSRLGVPQTRKRVIIIGFREDLGLDPAGAFPRSGPRRAAIRDVLPDVARVYVPSGTDIAARHYNWRGREKSWPAYGPGPTMCAKGLGIWLGALARVELRDGERRPPTIAEIAALCGFPPGFFIPLCDTAAWKVLGNAVPPPMARSWAERLADMLA